MVYKIHTWGFQDYLHRVCDRHRGEKRAVLIGMTVLTGMTVLSWTYLTLFPLKELLVKESLYID